MCGLAGFLDFRASRGREEMERLAGAMADTLAHRGPDARGVWAQGGAALGHRRLSILDLSAEGSQPMLSADGRWVAAYNGEIYNYRELRRELEDGRPEWKGSWRGTSDTEILLAAVCHWGVEEAVRRLNGMFALALWDRRERVLHLCRDRLGEKPLYYGWMGKSFLFASELGALIPHPDLERRVDRGALALFMRHNYVPCPWCIYEGLKKLPPATLLAVRLDSPGDRPEPKTYWSARDAALQGLAHPLEGTEEELTGRLEELLSEAVAMRMVSDVPLGAFLSGGVDSSAVVALMRRASDRPVKTFSIGFEEEAFDEAPFARAVAAHLGTDHTELYVTPREALEVVPLLPRLYSEPFADSSQIPTFLVSKLARTEVTVSLSGDGGDELFGGYDRYFWAQSLWGKVSRLPGGLRRALAGGLSLLPAGPLGRLIRAAAPNVPAESRDRDPSGLAQRVVDLLAAPGPEEMYRDLVSHWKARDRVVPGAVEPPYAFTLPGGRLETSELISRLMFLDLITYLPGDILVKLDRASMGVSLESRVPLLDHRVVEFAWSLPLGLKVRGGRGKHILREVLYRYVPRKLLERPKKGFGVPVDRWLRGPLRDWAEALLAPDRLAREGWLDAALVRRRWEEHLAGRGGWHYYLWDVLMFQAWLETWGG